MPLPEITIDTQVAVQNRETKLFDIYGVVVDQFRKYSVKTANGRILIRNHKFIRKHVPNLLFPLKVILTSLVKLTLLLIRDRITTLTIFVDSLRKIIGRDQNAMFVVYCLNLMLVLSYMLCSELDREVLELEISCCAQKVWTTSKALPLCM